MIQGLAMDNPSLLDNELVYYYFHRNHGPADHNEICRWELAYRIVDAMQQPIRKGERYLYINHFDSIVVESYVGHPEFVSDIPKTFHPHYLRLPDTFQKKACFHNSGSMGIEHPCPECGETLCWNLDLSGKPSKPTPSPEKENYGCCDGCWKYPSKHDCTCHKLKAEKCEYQECFCSDYPSPHSSHPTKPKDAVEEKIHWIKEYSQPDVKGVVDVMCRDLVRLARETK